MNCEYCKKTLTTKSNLNYHQKTNKSCISIQEGNNSNIKILLLSCDFCKESFAKKNLSRHLEVCKIKPLMERINKEKDLKNEKDLEVKRDQEIQKVYEMQSIKNEMESIKNEKDIEIDRLKNEINELKFLIYSLKGENSVFRKGQKEIIKVFASKPRTNVNKNLPAGKQ